MDTVEDVVSVTDVCPVRVEDELTLVLLVAVFVPDDVLVPLLLLVVVDERVARLDRVEAREGSGS